MKSKITLSAGILISVMFCACSPREPDEQALKAYEPAYHVVDEGLARIRSDFNAMQDEIRLVFIIGPSCGICLRGMDDLNEAIVQDIQDDPRVHTLAIHVPTLGADERHVAAAIPLLAGPRVTHYWDPVGNTGRQFQEALDISMYAWDLWFIYEPGAQWEDGALPPMPDYWEHQLPGLPDDRKLDADRFSAQVTSRLADLPPATEVPTAENGRTWRIYIDSHTGDAFRNVLLDSDGNEDIRIDYADYREADGFRLPHRVEYFANGLPLAIDRFSSIEVAVRGASGESTSL